jgi:hypothetical protein
MAMSLDRAPSHPRMPRPESTRSTANALERPKRKRVSFREIAEDNLKKFASTEADASRYLAELAGALEHFDAKTALLPNGTSFEHLGWNRQHAEEMLDAAFAHYERLSKERRLAEHRAAEETQARAALRAPLLTRPVERPATIIQDLENRKIVIETNLRELRSEIPGVKPSVFERAKNWWRDVTNPGAAKETRAKIGALEQELREVQREIEAERAALRKELHPTFIQTPRRALRNLGQDIAGSFVGGVDTSSEQESALADARARGDAPSEGEMQERQDEWDAWQADRSQAKPARAYRGADEIEASRSAWKEFQADAAARRREKPARRSPEDAKAAEAEWDRMLAETKDEKRNAPKRNVDRATIDANPAIFKTKGRVAKETANDILAGFGVTDYTADKERATARRYAEDYPEVPEEERSAPDDFERFEADLDRSALAEHLAPIDTETLRGPGLLRLSATETERIERILKAQGLDAAAEWQRVNQNASMRLVDDVAAYNVANAYVRNLALASSVPGKDRSVAEHNLARLETFLAQAERPKRAARKPSQPRPASDATSLSGKFAS